MWLQLSRYFAYVSMLSATIVLFICGMMLPIGQIMSERSKILFPDYLGNAGNLNTAVRNLEAGVLSLFGCSTSFVFLTFTAILYYGLKELKSGCVVVYIYFGIQCILLFAIGAVFTMIDSDSKKGGYVLLGCGVYSACLLVIYMAYREIKAKATIASVLHALESRDE